jgi:hypothetical protein
MVWCPMSKGVINLYRYREVALASNRRYLDALAVVDDPQPAYRQVEELTEPVVVSGRVHAGFNPASPGDVRRFQAVLAGEDLLHGFRDAEIRAALYGATEEVGERRRRGHAVGRMLKRLHVRSPIVKCRAAIGGTSARGVSRCSARSCRCIILGSPRPCAPRRDPPRRCPHGAEILRSKILIVADHPTPPTPAISGA